MVWLLHNQHLTLPAKRNRMQRSLKENKCSTMMHCTSQDKVTSNSPKIKPIDFGVIKLSEESASELVNQSAENSILNR